MQHVIRKFLEILASKQTFIFAIPADSAPIQYPVHTYIVQNTRLIVFSSSTANADPGSKLCLHEVGHVVSWVRVDVQN